MKTETPRPILLKDYRPPSYLIDSVSLDVALHKTRTRVVSQLKARPNPAVSKPGALQLDGELLELEQVKLNGRALGPKDYTITDKQLVIAAPPKAPFELEIITTCNPDANKALSGLYLSKGIYCTQCEAEGFRRITYFLDRPDVLATYTVRIEADIAEAPVLLSNGNLVEKGDVKGRERRYAVWHDPHPKPCYLFALVGGNLTSIASDFTTVSGRRVKLGIYVEPGKEKRCAWAMDSLKRSMKWDEERFGREYDLDVFNIVAVSDFNMGAMENKGLNIFNDALVLASPETATDLAFLNIERVIAHEYFHNWTGNRITCRDWFQLCLKEGLTVFRDQEFGADMRSPAEQRIAEVRNLKARQFPEDAGPLAHPVRPSKYIEINNFYTATVYEKGAEVVRMLQTLLGRDGFRKGMDLYFERHDGQAATVEDFVTCFADVSGRDLGQFMTWYAQAGTPEVTCALKYDAESEIAELVLTQTQAPTPGEVRKKPLHIPIKLGLLDSDGREMPLTLASGEHLSNGLIELRKKSETFRFRNVPSRPVVSLLREFSAPVNLSMQRSDAELAFLMGHDSDLFNRWQATQDYAARVLTQTIAARAAKVKGPSPKAFIEALAVSLRDQSLHPGYLAQFLTLPSENDIARIIAHDVDPLAIHKARTALRKAIAARLYDSLTEIYDRMATPGRYSPASESAGRRALRTVALGYLASSRAAEDVALVARHFEEARNLTDEMAALSILSEINTPEREAALARFYKRWKDDHLVIDGWFATQAASPLASTLATIKRLTQHPLFSIKNPNKVRALIGVLATGNPVTFNRPDGKGYEFVADRVLEIDAFNPQIAARLLAAFRGWKVLEPVRRAAARSALQRVADAKPLSNDVFEIVSRMLE